MNRTGALLMLLALAPAAWAGEQASQVFEHVSPSVYSIVAQSPAGTMLGSGVVVSSGYIITNNHVINGARAVRVQHDGDEQEATIASTDPHHDLALLHVYGLSAPAIHFGESGALRVGQTVYAVGSPRGLELSLSEGLVASLRPLPDGHVIQTTAPISPGSSGGGLFDEYGRLVGITTAQVVNGQNLNFALPVEWLHYVGVSVTLSPATAPARPAVSAATQMPAPVLTEVPQPPAPSAATGVPVFVARDTPQAAGDAARAPRVQLIPADPVRAQVSMPLVLAGGGALGLLVVFALRGRSAAPLGESAVDHAQADRAASVRAQRMEPFRQQARDEIKQDRREADTWLRALEQAHGNPTQALVAYIEMRSQALYKGELDRRWEAARGSGAQSPPRT